MTRFLLFVNFVYISVLSIFTFNVFQINSYFDRKSFFVFFYILFFVINLIIIKNISKFNFNSDLLFKFYSLTLRRPSFFLNYLINNLKKIYLFFFHFKYYKEYSLVSRMFKHVYNTFFIIWRPLFKKFSYFGYFRSNRSKWIK